ncbi:hypothetical protein BDD12DRAFT_807417 [Trichophaea hybrida]|nr:hypothetical protein BDD12DRAFT_807417 [Trichophaea hybrida]
MINHRNLGGGGGASTTPAGGSFGASTTPTLSSKAIPPKYPTKPAVRLGLNPALEKLEIQNQRLPLSAQLSPRADIIVALYRQEGDSLKYAVESNVLRSASPVFRAMLGENFKEGAELVSSRNELYTLELPDDDAKAMYTLLCILHHISLQVPTKMTHSELLHIAITSEKYDCYEALFPWIQMWLPQAAALKDDNDALLIAWSFRYKALFEAISRVLILECPVASDGTIVTNSGGPFHETIPESVLSKILQRRNDVVDKILGVCLSNTKLYAHSDDHLCCKKTTSASQGQGCDTMMLGAITKCLISAGLNPENHASKKRSSAVYISDLLHGLRNRMFSFVRQNSCQPPPRPVDNGLFSQPPPPRPAGNGLFSQPPQRPRPGGNGLFSQPPLPPPPPRPADNGLFSQPPQPPRPGGNGLFSQPPLPPPPPRPAGNGLFSQPPQTGLLTASSSFCAVHGDESLCPGATFHVECDFLPQMLREVNEIFDGVVGLSLDDFESRKVLSRDMFSTSLGDEV